MATCIHHPKRETRYRCFKDEVYLCDACLKCRSPEIYCKHREACPIWFQERRGFGDETPPGQAPTGPTKSDSAPPPGG